MVGVAYVLDCLRARPGSGPKLGRVWVQQMCDKENYERDAKKNEEGTNQPFPKVEQEVSERDRSSSPSLAAVGHRVKVEEVAHG